MAAAESPAAARAAEAPEGSFESIEVVQPAVPSLRVELNGPSAPTVSTEGMPGVTAVEMDRGEAIGLAIAAGKKSGGGNGGGGGGTTFTKITIRHKDGSTDTITHCEPA